MVSCFEVAAKVLRPVRGIESVHPSPKEQAKLQHYAPAPMVVKYLLWRQAMIALLLPLSLAHWIWEAVDLDADLKEQEMENHDNITAIALDSVEKFSNFASTTTLVLSVLNCICLAVALYYSTHWRRSRMALTIAFVIPFIFSFAQFVIPLRHFFEKDFSKALHAVLDDELEELPENYRDLFFTLLDYLFRALLVFFVLGECLLTIGPSAMCLLPALIRGGLIVKKILPGSPEAGWIMRSVPYFLAPLLGFVLFVLVQASDSYFITAVALVVLCAFLSPAMFFTSSLVRCQSAIENVKQDLARGGAARLSLLLIAFALIIAFLIRDPAGQFVVGQLSPAGIARFVLHFAITYNTLSVLSADWIIEFLAIMQLERAKAPAATLETYSSTIAAIRNGMKVSDIPGSAHTDDIVEDDTEIISFA
jgi:hypothetical protein